MGLSGQHLFEALYQQLGLLARARLRRERQPISTGTLVHELWLSMADGPPQFESQAHFLAYACKAMRSLLVDMARRRLAAKNHAELVSLTAAQGLPEGAFGQPEQWLQLDQALSAVARQHPRLARIAELYVLAGLSQAEIASVLDVHPATVERDWALAKGLLYQGLGHVAPQHAPQHAAH